METGNVAKKSIFESILAKHLVLNFFELIRNFIKLLIREVLLPCREDDSVLAGGMVRVHQNEAVKYFCQGFGIGGGDLRAIRDGEHIVSDLASSVVLGNQDVCIFLELWPLFPNHRKNMLLFEHTLVIILAEGAKRFRRAVQSG